MNVTGIYLYSDGFLWNVQQLLVSPAAYTSRTPRTSSAVWQIYMSGCGTKDRSRELESRALLRLVRHCGPAFLTIHLHYVWPKRANAVRFDVLNFYVSIIWSGAQNLKSLSRLSEPAAVLLSRARLAAQEYGTNERRSGRAKPFFSPLHSPLPPSLPLPCSPLALLLSSTPRAAAVF